MINQENESRISDEDKAWTAANAENEFRKKAAKRFGKNPGALEERIIREYANKAGERRVQDYNAGKEEQWDNLRKKAEQLIHKCEFHLNKKFGSVEAAAQQLSNIVDSGNVHQDLIKTSYKLLLEAIDSLKSSIKEINIDQGKNIRESGADFLAPEQAIEEWEVNIMKALEWISESKEIMENRGQS